MPSVTPKENSPGPAAPREVLELVDRFERQLDAYQSGHYLETQLRREFLDPFFKALGWDVDNTQGHAEAYKDVVHEDVIRIGGATKAPDYGFRIGGTRKFFVEAKKPSVVIRHEPTAAYQLRRYAWSARLPLSILTDFEEFAVYDGRVRPHQDDGAAQARLFYCTFREFAARWDWIAGIFSREAVLKGDFDRFAATTKSKRGTTEFDQAFLATLEGWRLDLARNLALRNPRLTQRPLNFAVQRIIDRIVFLRIAEDRGLEDYGRLRALVNGDRIYPRLCQLFEAADARYNSGLFHFQRERDRPEDPDELTLGLELDDRLLRDILRGLYYPDSPYEFSVVTADILGQVYEQFLGQVIRLTEGHRAVVEAKPEVRKAGGVYYTPTYIVDYIVRQTLGRMLTDLTGQPPGPTEAAETAPRRGARVLDRVAQVRVLDPACGSGSFLIGAYQLLLDWHRDWYVAHDPDRHARGAHPTLVRGADGWKLTIAERKRILLNHIYGVDVDAQAVEVTKLSLLLKVLEGETGQTLQTLFRFTQERALPDLGRNIKCGNALVGPDFYEQPELAALTDEDRYRLNVFDWPAEFPQVFWRAGTAATLHETTPAPLSDYTRPGVPLHGTYSTTVPDGDSPAPSRPPEWEGGFDVVIGNPPYVRIQGFPACQVRYLTTHYASATGNCDLYVSFVEKGYRLLRERGRLGYILPNKFFRTDYGEGLRHFLSARRAVSGLVDFGASQVFKATTYTCLLFLRQGGEATFHHTRAEASASALAGAVFSPRDAAGLNSSAWTFESDAAARLLTRLGRHAVRLLDLPAAMSRGSSTGDDEVFVIAAGDLADEAEILREPLFASDFGRYRFTPAGSWKVLFPYVCEGGRYRLYTEEELHPRFPRAAAALQAQKERLKRRKQCQEWFGFSAPRNLALHDRAQIAVPLLADRGLCALIPEGKRGRLCPMAGGGFTITLAPECPMRPEYVLGLLNSRLLFWRLQGLSNVFRGGWITCTKQYFGELPIRVINFAEVHDRARHDRMVGLVETMLELNRQATAARTPQEKTVLERHIAATDGQIDRLVYELYGLTEDDIGLVEGRAG